MFGSEILEGAVIEGCYAEATCAGRKYGISIRLKHHDAVDFSHEIKEVWNKRVGLFTSATSHGEGT